MSIAISPSPFSGFSLTSLSVQTTELSPIEKLLNGAALSHEGMRVLKLCKLMGDEQRFRIACLLHYGPSNVDGMVKILHETQPALSHHLAIFKKEGVLQSDPIGKNRIYTFSLSGAKAMNVTAESLLAIQASTPEDPPAPDPISIPALHEEGNALTQAGKDVVRTFRLLGDKVRLNILLRLSGYEMNVTQMCEVLGKSQPAVSHHLARLRDESKLLTARRDGKHHFYAPEDSSIQQIHHAARVLKTLVLLPQAKDQETLA